MSSICLLILLNFFSNVCGAAEVGVTDTEILLGNHSTQTGPQAAYGVFQRAMKAYFDVINEKGGIHGRKINLLIADSAGNPQQALSMTKKMVEQDKIFAFVAGGNLPHLAVFRYLRQKGVPDLFVASGAPEFTQPPFKTTFGWTPPSNIEGEMYAEYFIKRWPDKKIGVLYDDAALGRNSMEAFKKAASGKLNVVAIEANDSRVDPSPKAQILKLKELGAEVVYLATVVGVTPIALKFASEQGYHPQWVLGFNSSYQNTLDLAGKKATEGTLGWYYTYTEAETSIPGVKEHIEFMKTRLPNEKPSVGSMAGQGVAELIVEVLTRAGKDLTRDGVVKAAEALKDWKCKVCRSPNSMSASKHVIMDINELNIAKDGSWARYDDKIWSELLERHRKLVLK